MINLLNSSNITAWLPLIVAFIAGSFALWQIRSNNIRAARIKWLETLKGLIADFLSENLELQLKISVMHGIDEARAKRELTTFENETYREFTKAKIQALKTIDNKGDMILFNLNPKEKLHQKLETIIDEYFKILNLFPKANDLSEFFQTQKSIAKIDKQIKHITRVIVKIEWEKTKRIRFCYWLFMLRKGNSLINEALKN